MIKSVLTLFLSLILFGISINTIAKADIVIIANKSFPTDNIEKFQAQKLWLGKIHKLPDVGKVKVVDQSNNSPIKEFFYEKLTSKTLSDLKVYWAKIIFTGKATPPKALSSDKKIIDYLVKHDEYLGYIDHQSITDDVKVLMTIE